jgi:heme exporter protein C
MTTSFTSSSWIKGATTATGLVAVAVVAWAIYVIFLVVPDERIMGAVQRIFYFHVASAIASYVAFGGVFFFSIAYLGTKEKVYDVLNAAAAELGFIFCTITLVSGMIWGHAAWNVWFRWEPRLVTFLLLWFLASSFLVIRSFGNPQQIRTHSAIIGILGAITVPLVWFSVKLVPEIAQLHPQVLDKQGLKSPAYGYGLMVAVVAVLLLGMHLFLVRYRLGVLEERSTEALHEVDI